MKLVNILRILTITLVILGTSIIANKIYINKKEETILTENYKNKMLEIQKERLKKQKEITKEKYLNCLNSPYKEDNLEENINTLIEEYQEKNIGFYFKDLKNNYEIKLKEQEIFYGASIIKLLEAEYLIERAIEGKINLNEQIQYEERHISDYSKGMEKYQIKDQIPLKELIYYSISVSDNTAHEMLYEYIGLENLKRYADQLGISLTINEVEHFGDLTPESGMKIIEKAYQLITLNNSYSELLMTSMNNDYYNSLNFKEHTFLHKYGYTEPYYNDIGIYYTANPYLISIFTTYANEDYQKIVNELNEKIYKIYQNNINQKHKRCELEKSNI